MVSALESKQNCWLQMKKKQIPQKVSNSFSNLSTDGALPEPAKKQRVAPPGGKHLQYSYVIHNSRVLRKKDSNRKQLERLLK